ncbi:putative bifunctional diguanylate cyclase/phosphodiesterase [Aminobacter carboxidus]|uniref:Diguanylate cyclase (GGDEF)-like protein/PAS domain S-box-containing protein n=1 Tax=Aminobacter carboxidus TaxID=376165 RepID=A0A8E2BDK7_9HYPH|nr:MULTISPECIES: EAL domain-containing protein [Aminobacter carboxidus group]MBB6465910.1 diguanylate cyclase (GGDEF)-like protein/PAS domain S-box-containing protein [Aminobacter lissarensis]MBE1204369.1 EAL domain-containing protein [Aminobacter carboxidus]
MTPTADASPLAGFVENIEFALVVIDAGRNISFVNKSAERMFGYDRAEMVGQTLDLIIPARLRGAHNAGIARVGAGEPSKLSGKTVEVSALRRDGSEFPIELSLSVWQGPNGVSMGGIIRDISERRQRDMRLHRLAHQDTLTGLPNRLQFDMQLEDALSKGEATGLLLVDLDGFKKVNDTLGHATGDTLLQALAVRLPAALDANAMVARLGSDEFAVLLRGIDKPAAVAAAANSLLHSFEQPFEIGDHLLKLGVSIGGAVAPRDGAEPEELMASADLALFRARQQGSSYRIFEPGMRNAVAVRRALQDELLRAIGAREFVLHYQPQVCLESGKVLGAEALLRWNHPSRGLLAPADFLAVLETHSGALTVGNWILEEACRQSAKWRADGFAPITMAINLFAVQVNAGNLADTVTSTLSRHGLPANALELEVTETIALDYEERTLAPFRKLGKAGVGLAFDDFGTGHAALSTIKRFPLTVLKVDRSFVRDMLRDPQDAAIVRAVLGMARDMGLSVVAEGIETRAQEAALYAMGCRVGQGYLYSKALPASEFERMLKQAEQVPEKAPAIRF